MAQDTSLIELYLKAPMPNLNWARREALRAKAYYDLKPYPVFAYQEWKIEDRGPLPQCMPFCANIVDRSAKWLFGKPPRITVTNKKAEDTVLTWFNQAFYKLKQAAIMAMNEGSVTLRFAFDADKQEGYFSFLSTLDCVRYVYDPHDVNTVMIAYVQYPFYEIKEKKWKMYREAWTKDTYCVFVPQDIVFRPIRFGSQLYGNVAFVAADNDFITPERYEDWKIDGSKTGPNPLGFIPLVQIRDDEGDTVYGRGVLWKVTHIIDKINLAYHLMDRSNQYDSEPTMVFIDAELDSLDDAQVSPGGALSINTRETADSGNRQAKANLIEPSGRLRAYMSEYTSDLRQQVSEATGTVEISAKEVSNKGNFTQSVLNQIYAPLIESTDARRQNWERKIEDFLAECAKGVSPFMKFSWAESDRFDLQWPEYFIVSDQDKALRLDRLVKQEGLGLTTKDRVIQDVAAMDGISDVEGLVEDLENYVPEYEELLDKGKPDMNPNGDPPPISTKQQKPKQAGDNILE